MSQRKRAEKLIVLAQPLSDYTDQRLLGEGVWAAKALLEALNTIDRLEAENASLREAMQSDVSGATDYDLTWQALNGGSE